MSKKSRESFEVDNLIQDVEQQQHTGQDDAPPNRRSLLASASHDSNSSSSSVRIVPVRGSASLLGMMGQSSRAVLRMSEQLDMETGEVSSSECRVQEITGRHLQTAMSRRERRKRQLFGSLVKLGVVEEGDEDASSGDEEQGNVAGQGGDKEPKKHYRLTKVRAKSSWIHRLCGLASDEENDFTSKSDLATSFFRWTFRTTYMMLFLSAALMFWVFTIFWAMIIHGVGVIHPECISVGGKNYTEAGEHYMDSYALSWTTFSTVGYGIIYPELSIKGGKRCIGINLLTTLASFVGILFVGFMSAVIFGKISKSQSAAQTLFSDPILITYGSGVKSDEEEEEEDGDADQKAGKAVSGTAADEQTGRIPCPLLEFRVANRMYSVPRGEIVNASVTCVACLFESMASESIRESVKHPSHQRKFRMFQGPKFLSGTTKSIGKVLSVPQKHVSRVGGAIGKSIPRQQICRVTESVMKGVASPFMTIKEDSSYDPDEARSVGSHDFASFAEAEGQHQVVVEDPSARLVPRRIFSNLEVDTPSHPFFKRVWTIRHKLDQNSPLLSTEARVMVAENNGFWPPELNNYLAIREHVHFDQIIVSLSGTANATGNTVYGQKVYEFCDMNVGWSFAPVLVRGDDRRILVDLNLLNDVCEQRGGGAEPFTDVVDGRDAMEQVTAAAHDVAERVAGATHDMAEQLRHKQKETKQKVAGAINTAKKGNPRNARSDSGAEDLDGAGSDDVGSPNEGEWAKKES